MAAFTARTEETLANLMKQRTVLNVRRKRRRTLYTALADAEALAPVKELYEAGLSGMETEFAQYMDAVAALEQCGVPRERLIQEKAELYERLAELNRRSGRSGGSWPCAGRPKQPAPDGAGNRQSRSA